MVLQCHAGTSRTSSIFGFAVALSMTLAAVHEGIGHPSGTFTVSASDAYTELTWLPEKYVFWLTEEYREAAAARASA